MTQATDYTGCRFGYLVLLRKGAPQGAGVGALWWARCDCGTTKLIRAREAARGHIRSCGLCQHARRLKSQKTSPAQRQEQALRRGYAYLLKLALDTGVPLELKLEDFQTLVMQPCTLCDGEAPKEGHSVALIDNARSYTLETSFTCCARCRRWRGRSNWADLLKHVNQIHETVHKALTDADSSLTSQPRP